MKYLVGIGFVNRTDLLDAALQSIPSYWDHTLVVDNSEEHRLRSYRLADKIKIIEPMVPFSYAQTMNYMRKLAINGGYQVLIAMHHDTVANPGTSELFLQTLQSYLDDGVPWGVAFTTCYSMVAYHVEALRMTGEWDYMYLPNYFTDTDYYRRLALAGYGWRQTGLPVTHHDGGGNTCKADPALHRLQQITTPLYLRYYMTKWGGAPGQEVYSTVFNT